MFLVACLFSRCIKYNLYLVVSQCSIASLIFQQNNAVVVGVVEVEVEVVVVVVVQASITM